MKKSIIFSITFAVLILFSFKPADPGVWTVDKAHAKLGFTVTHMAISEVEGWFKTFDAKITTTGDDFTNAIAEMTADVSSINTENTQRDTHLKSADFFDVVKYPTLTFKSKTFVKINENNYKVTGDITMHGVTKTINLDVLCRTGINPQTKKPIAGFKISGTLKRSDFGIGTSMAAAVIGDEITLICNAEFQKN